MMKGINLPIERRDTNGRLNPGSVGKMWTDLGKSQKSDYPTLEFVGKDRLIVFSSTWSDGLG